MPKLPMLPFLLVVIPLAQFSFASDVNVRLEFNPPNDHRVQDYTMQVRFFIGTDEYEISKEDSIHIKIHWNERNILVHSETTVDRSNNSVYFWFSLRKSGEYKIGIKLNGVEVNGSPITQTYVAVDLDPTLTRFKIETPAVLCVTNTVYQYIIEPRDQFGNLCESTADKYELNLRRVEGSQVLNNVEYEFVDEVENTVLKITFGQPGIVACNVTYGDEPIQNGRFELHALTPSEYRTIDENMKGERPCVYKGFMSRPSKNGLSRRDIYIKLTPKEFVIKKRFWKISSRIGTYQMTDTTFKRDYYAVNSKMTLEIYDGRRPKRSVEFQDEHEARVLLGNIAYITNLHIENLDPVQKKATLFYKSVKQCRNVSKTLVVRRNDIILSTWEATRDFTVANWLTDFHIEFLDEEGVDSGGLLREWFSLVTRELCESVNQDPEPAEQSSTNENPKHTELAVEANRKRNDLPEVANQQGAEPPKPETLPSGLFRRFPRSRLSHPNPARNTKTDSKLFKMAGKIVAKSLRESAKPDNKYRQVVHAKFTHSVLAQLIGLPVKYENFVTDHPNLNDKAIMVMKTEMDSLGDDVQFFTEEEVNSTVDLVPNGSTIPVTDNTKVDYLNALAKYHLTTKMEPQIDAFIKGFSLVIPQDLLMIFNVEDLELVLCGKNVYSVKDWRQHHKITIRSPGKKSTRMVNWFWKLLGTMSEVEKGQLLNFTTGSSLLPAGGFKQISPLFHIKILNPSEDYPTASTCYNEISIPLYKSYETLEEKIKIALKSGSENFGLV